jgi:hypothetical protein
MQEIKDRLYDKRFILGGFRRRKAIKTLAASGEISDLLLLAEALDRDHPDKGRLVAMLLRLDLENDAARITALWAFWAERPRPGLAKVLAALGWPPGVRPEIRLMRGVLGAATADAPEEVNQASAVFARVLPISDEAVNNEIYLAWVRSRSEAFEKLLADQKRLPGQPELEALYALVVGDTARYEQLKDESGELLALAFGMAPEAFQERMSRTVAASPSRRLKESYRVALLGGGLEESRKAESLKLVGDEDGLFELIKGMALGDALSLCERWAETGKRPNLPENAGVVERAVGFWKDLGRIEVTPGPALPEGMEDIFAWWRNQAPSDADLRADLKADDPLQKARGLYMGHEKGWVGDGELKEAAGSEHWPLRLAARLLSPGLHAAGGQDHVHWVSLCAGDAGLLQMPVSGSPDDHRRHSERLQNTRGQAASRTRTMLEILCTFQGAFVAGGVTVEDQVQPTETESISVGDYQGEVDFS